MGIIKIDFNDKFKCKSNFGAKINQYSRLADTISIAFDFEFSSTKPIIFLYAERNDKAINELGTITLSYNKENGRYEYLFGSDDGNDSSSWFSAIPGPLKISFQIIDGDAIYTTNKYNIWINASNQSIDTEVTLSVEQFNNIYKYIQECSYIVDLSNYVDTMNKQSISGVKTFENVTYFEDNVYLNSGFVYTADIRNSSKIETLDLDVSGNANIYNCDVTQDLTTKNLSLSNKVKSNLTPYDDRQYNLGSSSKGWKNLYVDQILLSGGTDSSGNPIYKKVLSLDESGWINFYSSNGYKFLKTNGYELDIVGYFGKTEGIVFKTSVGDTIIRDVSGNKEIELIDDGSTTSKIKMWSDGIRLSSSDKISFVPLSSSDVETRDYHRVTMGGNVYGNVIPDGDYYLYCQSADNDEYNPNGYDSGEIVFGVRNDGITFAKSLQVMNEPTRNNDATTKNYVDNVIPKKTSELTNDSGFIDRLVTNLANYYLKSETYTKEEVLKLVNSISTLTLKKVEKLPTENISTNTIYLLLKQDGVSPNIYEEYIYVNGDWEIIGTTEVDLSNYLTIEQGDEKYALNSNTFSFAEISINGPKSVTIKDVYESIQSQLPNQNSDVILLRLTGYLTFTGFAEIRYVGAYLTSLFSFKDNKFISNYYSADTFIDDILSSLSANVDVSSEQEISGVKTFTNQTRFTTIYADVIGHFGSSNKYTFRDDGTAQIYSPNNELWLTDTVGGDTFAYSFPQKSGTVALLDDLSNLSNIENIKIIKDETFEDYHSFAAKCIELDSEETKYAYVGSINVTTSQGSLHRTKRTYCLGLVNYSRTNNLTPTIIVTIISSSGEMIVSDGTNYSPISTPAVPISDNDVTTKNYVDNVIPKKTSQLNNDSEFVSKDSIAKLNGIELTNGGNIATKDISVNEIRQIFTEGAGETDISENYTFESITTPVTVRQRACCYGNGYFVIAGTSGALVYSTDKGKTWTNLNSFTSAVITGIAYGNGIFVCVDSSGNIWKTDIPSNEWVLAKEFGTDIIIESVRYINNEFVAVGHYGLITKSNDAIHWQQVHKYEDTTTDNYLIDVCYGNGKYVAVGKSGLVLTSTNTVVWYDNTIADYNTNVYDIRAIIYTNGTFVVGTKNGRIDYSEDLNTWTQASHPTDLSVSWIRNFAYGDNRLYTCMYAGTSKGYIWYSEDKGKTWEVAHDISSMLWCICFGEDTFIASGDIGLAQVLDLGLSWTSTVPNTDFYYYKLEITQNDGSKTYSDIYYTNHKYVDLTNDLKTINGESIVGEGDIKIEGGRETRPLKEYVEAGVTTKQLEPNKYYIFDSQVASDVTITLAKEDDTYLDEFMGEIKVDESDINVTFPNTIRWNDNGGVTNTDGILTLEAKNTYLFSIANSLGLITNIPNPSLAEAVYTISGNVVSWEEVANATAYDVYNGEVLLVENTTSTSIDMSAYLTDAGEYTIKVISKSNYYVDSTTTITYYITAPLSAPTNLVLADTGTLSWDAVENAESYEVYEVEGGTLLTTVTVNYVDLTTITTLTGTHTIKVKAINSTNPNVYTASELSSGIYYTWG